MRPNILLITTHDSGRHFGCYGVPTVNTPRIDRIAAEGVRLAQCFAAAPICCAARASMLTGMYPQSNGQMDLCFPPFNWAMHDPRWHASHVLRDLGYHTCLWGVQHEVQDPQLLGFDEQRLTGRSLSSAIDVANNVAEFLQTQRNATRPFFAQVGFFETHSPFDWKECPPDSSRGVHVPPLLNDSPTAQRVMALLQGSLRRVDDAVGIIEDALHLAGLAENTLLVFTTDHGLEIPLAKWHLRDAGLATAMIFRWPGGGVGSYSATIPADAPAGTGADKAPRVCDHLLSHVDFLPTVLELAECPIPAQVQGWSFAAALRDSSIASLASKTVFAMYQKSSSRCVRTRRYKLIRHFALATLGSVPSSYFMRYNPDALDVNERMHRRGVPDLYPAVELFDLEADPAEQTNIARVPENQAVVTELEAMLWQWMESVDDPLLRGPERTPFYEQSIGAYHTWRKPQG